MDRLRLLDGRLKLRHLVFVDVLTRQGSVTSAAAVLHITQPVATRTLRDLEAILGVSLYERGPRGVTPTIFGETFTQYARVILSQLSQASRHVVELAAADCGNVIVGCDPAGSGVLLLEALARLKAQRPGLTVVMQEGSAEALSVELTAGRIDVMVGRLGSQTSRGEVATALYGESLAVFTRVGHPLVAAGVSALADVVGYGWIIPGEPTALRGEAEQLFAHHEMGLPGNRMEVSSFLSAHQLLLDTDLVAVLPATIGRGQPGLAALAVGSAPVSYRIGITTAAGRSLSPGAAALIDTLQTIAADHLDDPAQTDMPKPRYHRSAGTRAS